MQILSTANWQGTALAVEGLSYKRDDVGIVPYNNYSIFVFFPCYEVTFHVLDFAVIQLVGHF